MEHTLRCNALKCRRELTDKALVTTCSHIFCTECATRLGLTDSSARHLCPACNVSLTNPDDAVIANLRPTEDYKTSVLSGLSPNVIIECASRALNFWAYQTIQQIIYQEHVSKALVDKYTNLTIDLDKVITDANTQITTLNNKVSSMDLDQQALRRKNEELAVALKEKNKKLMQTQELYDKLKRRAMMGQMQHAAENAVDSNLPSLDVREGDGQGISPRNEAAVLGLHEAGMGPSFPEFHHVRISNENDGGVDHARSFNHRRTGLYPWDQVAGGSGEIPPTPSTHRQRIGLFSGIGLTSVPGMPASTRSPRQFGTGRAALVDLPGTFRNTSRLPGVGLSSGLKTSHNGSGLNEFAVPTTRPQAIQRPVQGPSGLGQGYRPESVLGNSHGFTSR